MNRILFPLLISLISLLGIGSFYTSYHNLAFIAEQYGITGMPGKVFPLVLDGGIGIMGICALASVVHDLPAKEQRFIRATMLAFTLFSVLANGLHGVDVSRHSESMVTHSAEHGAHGGEHSALTMVHGAVHDAHSESMMRSLCSAVAPFMVHALAPLALFCVIEIFLFFLIRKYSVQTATTPPALSISENGAGDSAEREKARNLIEQRFEVDTYTPLPSRKGLSPAQIEVIRTLHQQGRGVSQIKKEAGFHRATIEKYVRQFESEEHDALYPAELV